MKQFAQIIFLLLFALNLNAQDWEKRHRFAKSYFGVSNFIVPNLEHGNFVDANGDIKQFERSGFLSPAINIGATHFWGYADIYVSINTSDIKFGKDDLENDLRLGTFTGLRVYPFPSQKNTIRPYVGYKFSPFRYKQTDIADQSYKFTKVKSVFDIGLGIQLPNFYFTVEYSRVANPSFDTYLSRNTTSKDKFPSQIFQIGINYTLETTRNTDIEGIKTSNEIFANSNKYGLFLAVGPSSAFPLKSSDYITDLHPFLDDKSFPNVFPDFGIGYHFAKTDFITALSFRPMSQSRNAYGFDQKITRNSILLEAYKFIADYHGFVPYVGVGYSYENTTLSETDNGNTITQLTKNQFSPALVFGWDIRPNAKGDVWILRTNLRYFPFLEIEHQDKRLSLQHLEFNFIQFVLYPQKLKMNKKR